MRRWIKIIYQDFCKDLSGEGTFFSHLLALLSVVALIVILIGLLRSLLG